MSALIQDKTAVTDFEIHELLQSRWSPRAFADGSIDKAILGSLIEAARWSASSNNQQPWRFVVATKEEKEAFARILGVIMESNQMWAKGAAALLIGVAKMTRDRDGAPNTYALYDVGQAVAHLSIQATALGLYVHQMGGFHRDQAREVLHIPADHDPVVAMAIGYLGDPDQLPEAQRERELSPRTRKPLTELAFAGDRGAPLFE